jgi:flagellar hook assembly protein FlgD
VYSGAINQDTGEVFFSTELGLCSFTSDATKPSTEMTKDNVWAYPNPVNPSYTGPITITGLTYNADVKIVSANGLLINEGRSNGGTFTWDGCDKNGERVGSGIYMVVTATSDGKKGTVCKIAIIR